MQMLVADALSCHSLVQYARVNNANHAEPITSKVFIMSSVQFAKIPVHLSRGNPMGHTPPVARLCQANINMLFLGPSGGQHGSHASIYTMRSRLTGSAHLFAQTLSSPARIAIRAPH